MKLKKLIQKARQTLKYSIFTAPEHWKNRYRIVYNLLAGIVGTVGALFLLGIMVYYVGWLILLIAIGYPIAKLIISII